MSYAIESVTTKALGVALDAASFRQQLIAGNIANASTAGYVPQHFEFSEQMAQARSVLATQGSLDPAMLRAFEFRAHASLDGAGAPESVRLDGEVAALAQNTVQYQALIKGLNKHFSILASAASDGKR